VKNKEVFKEQEAILIVSIKNFYLIPEKYSLNEIKAITLSRNHNQMVLHLGHKPDIHIHNDKIWEIMEAMQYAYFGSMAKNVPVYEMDGDLKN
jgi:hypothetical protein